MSFWYFWANGTILGLQPFAYFAPLVALIAFIVVVYVLTALKIVIDNKKQHILW